MKLKSSEIFIQSLRIHAPIGVAELEKKVGNDISITVSIRYSVAEAMVSDNVEQTLNYAEAASLIKQTAMKPAGLLEHLAWKIAKALFDRWKDIESVSLRIVKLAPPISFDTDGAGVYMVFDRD